MKLIHLFGIVLVAMVMSACAATPGTSEQPADVGWAIEGTWTDACCCDVACPCLFGNPATEGFCEGASVFDIESGHHEDVSLDGVTAVVTYRVAGWTKVSVSDEASPEQVEAVRALLPHMLPFTERGATPRVGQAPIEVSRRADTIRYSAPGTTVEIELVESANGEPIVLQNLPVKGTPFPLTHDHTQYRSRLLSHDSEADGFEWSGRNAFSSKFSLSGQRD